MGTLTKTLIILGITTALFISVCFVFVWHEKTIPDALISGYFGALGAEGGIMGAIKIGKEIVKLKKGIVSDE